jgi:hypothetical protein
MESAEGAAAFWSAAAWRRFGPCDEYRAISRAALTNRDRDYLRQGQSAAGPAHSKELAL